MPVFGLNRSFQQLSRYDAVELTAKERDRLRALDLWKEKGDCALACRIFRTSRATLYRWRKRFIPTDLTSIRDRSRRPRKVRRPAWSQISLRRSNGCGRPIPYEWRGHCGWRGHTEAFYEVTPTSWTITNLQQELFQSEKTYNTVRPDPALNRRAPLQFLTQLGIIPNHPSPSHMY